MGTARCRFATSCRRTAGGAIASAVLRGARRESSAITAASCVLQRASNLASLHCFVPACAHRFLSPSPDERPRPLFSGSQCQRCSLDFDHHCHILGSCIRGRGVRGNILPFRLLLASMPVGLIACLATLISGGLLLVNPEVAPSNATGVLALSGAWEPTTRLAILLGCLVSLLGLLATGLWVVTKLCSHCPSSRESRGPLEAMMRPQGYFA